MRKGIITALVLAIVVVAIAFGGTKLFLSWRKGGQAGLKITSTPPASVLIDGEFQQKTPYDEKLPAGTYMLKLTPEGTEAASWQHEVNLSSGLVTYVNRELGSTDLESAGETLSLEKIESERSEISVVSTPDGATVALDGQERGTTPLVIRDVEPGDHTLHVFAPGFNGRQVRVKTTKSYKLNAEIQLGLVPGQEEATESAELEETEGKTKLKVRILDTETGWLRVREGPSLSATEAAKVDPGKQFLFLAEEEGWFKIEYEEGKEGWVSSRYAEKIED